MSEIVERHWIVTKSQCANKPASELKRHATFESARREAERLAGQEKTEFYVYQFVGAAKQAKPPIEWTEPFASCEVE